MRLEEEKQATTHHDGLGFLVFAGCRRPGQAERGLELSLHLCTDHHTSHERVHITVTTTQQSDQLYNKQTSAHAQHPPPPPAAHSYSVCMNERSVEGRAEGPPSGADMWPVQSQPQVHQWTIYSANPYSVQAGRRRRAASGSPLFHSSTLTRSARSTAPPYCVLTTPEYNNR